MGRYTIYSSDGSTVRYTGNKLVYHGTYLSPSYVEFKEIASDTVIPWRVGDYIEYSRTGIRYTLYNVPQIVQNSEKTLSTKEKVVYSSVCLYAPTKQFENALFLDLVYDDNFIHYSNQESFSTYENVAGIALRIQSCLDYAYPNGGWDVQVASNISSDIPDITEPREFSMNAGQTVLDALNQIYSTWENLGWTYVYDSTADNPNILLIGGANVDEANREYVGDETFTVGKGDGLTKLKISVSSSADICTRLYAFGGTQNMPSRYYNTLGIANAESVDIPHLMIPTEHWGTTDGLPDAQLAYIDASAEAIAFLGIRPKVIYFDDSTYGSIYPSIEGVTIGDIRSSMSSTDEYYPSTAIYADTVRADAVKSSNTNLLDDGTISSSTYASKYETAMSYSDSVTIADVGTDEVGGFYEDGADPIATFNITGVTGTQLTVPKFFAGIFTVPSSVACTATLQVVDSSGNEEYIDATVSYNNDNTYTVIVPETTLTSISTTSSGTISYYLKVVFTATLAAQVGMYSLASGGYSAGAYLAYSYAKSCYVTIPQIGFDLRDYQSTNSNYGTLNMLDGYCGGMAFTIKGVTYNSATDDWTLELKRKRDTGVMYPNSSSTIQAGDHYTFTDIMMPELYVETASVRLYNRALQVLEDLSKPIVVLEPSIDAKFIIENPQAFLEGRYLHLDSSVLEATFGSVWTYSNLIDTLTINETEESVIPTYALTLREKKRRSWKTDDSSSTSSSSSSDSTDLEENVSSSSSGGSIDLSGYATTEALEEGLATKANVSHTHTTSDITDWASATASFVTTNTLSSYATKSYVQNNYYTLSSATIYENKVNTLQSSVSTNTTSISNLASRMTTAEGDIDGLETDVAANTAAISAETTARTSADTALQSSINTLSTTVSGKAEDDEVVHIAGTETVTGTKTFSQPVTVPRLVLSNGVYLEYDSDNAIVSLVGSGLYAEENITAGTASDARLKENVQEIGYKGAKNVLESLVPVGYEWNSIAEEKFNLRGKSEGFLAQDVASVIPDAVGRLKDGYLNLDKSKIIPYLVRGWQEHERVIADLLERIERLENGSH